MKGVKVLNKNKQKTNKTLIDKQQYGHYWRKIGVGGGGNRRVKRE